MPDAQRKFIAPITIAFMAGLMVLAWYLPAGWNWIAMMVVLALFILYLGAACTGRALGCLINDQKMMSLSRFQMIVWTVVIVSAYGAIAMERVKNGDVVHPLIVGIDWRVASASRGPAPNLRDGRSFIIRVVGLGLLGRSSVFNDRPLRLYRRTVQRV
jgi:hypothetical protein